MDIKPVLYVPDTWAIWNEADERGVGPNSLKKYKTDQLLEWYGIKSTGWERLVQNCLRKPEIMIVGENPSKNNDEILSKAKITIQCFHANSVLDRSLKAAIEQVQFFKGAYITDAFAWAYEHESKKIRLYEIRKRYPKFWTLIYEKAKDNFVEKINQGKGSKAIIALGNDAFRYIQEFLQLTTDIQPRVRKFEVASVRNSLRIYRVDHPSPLNAKFRGLFVQQLMAVAEDLTAERTPKHFD